MGKLDGKVAIITGASRGIGRDMALVFAKEGAKVVAAARTVNEGDFRVAGSLSTTIEKIKANGGDALAVRCDVTSDEDLEQLVKQTIAAYGRIDMIVNNGAIRAPGSLWEMQPKHFDLMFRVNVRGPFMLTRYVLPHMFEQRFGHILNVPSGASRMPGKGPYDKVDTSDASYGLTKTSLERLSQSMATQLWDKNVAVNVISPGSSIVTEGSMYFNQRTAEQMHGRYENGEIFGDAAVFIMNQDPSKFTGNIMTDEEYVKLSGGDLSKYTKIP